MPDDETPPPRFALPPAAEARAAAYFTMVSRILITAAVFGVAGKLGEFGVTGLLSGQVVATAAGAVLGLASLGLFALSMPAVIWSAAAFFGHDRILGGDVASRRLYRRFAFLAALFYVALVAVFVSDLLEPGGSAEAPVPAASR